MLTRDDVVDILAAAQIGDHRTVGDTDVSFWFAALTRGGVTSKADAIEAVLEHFVTSEAWLMPAHVIRGVRTIRAARLDACPPDRELMAGVDPKLSGREWVRIYRERRQRVANGEPVSNLRALSGGGQ